MNQNHLTHSLALLILPALLVACDRGNPETSGSTPVSSVQQPLTPSATGTERVEVTEPTGIEPIELDWDSLIPADWQLDKLMEEYNVGDLSDDDPRASELMEKLKTFWKEAPVVHDYDGKNIKLPGFVVPLETDAKAIQEFLLVPYYGACIHTPPPPANQTVYVVMDEGHPYQGELFDTVWVTGTLSVDKLSSELGDAGYRIEGRLVEPYE
jgi:hypothetical protein